MFDIDQRVFELCDTLQSNGHEAYIVGGAVRDLLLERKVSDWDVTTSAKPEDVAACFKKTINTGIAHGTVTVLIHSLAIEVTTFRGDGKYSDGRRPDSVAFVKTLREDLKRRDFTINAIAYDPVGKTLHDPFKGKEDLVLKKIRAVGDPHARFDEDGLRSLRALRFATTLEFAIEDKTKSAIPSAIERFKMVSVERVWVELSKILLAKRPSIGIRLLIETKMLDAILPELSACIGLTQNNYHSDDVFEHTLKVLDDVDGRLELRCAALLHDIAKPICAAPHKKDPKQNSFYGHDIKGAEMTAAIANRLKWPKKLRDHVAHLVRHHLFAMDPSSSKSAIRRMINRVDKDFLEELFILRRADLNSRSQNEKSLEQLDQYKKLVDEVLHEQPVLKTNHLAIDGRDLMKHFNQPSGRWIGKTMRALLEKVLDEPSLNQRDTLFSLAEDILKGK